jgi:hypothetical protein
MLDQNSFDDTCVAVSDTKNKEEILSSCSLRPGREKDESEQSTMHAQYMAFAV